MVLDLDDIEGLKGLIKFSPDGILIINNQQEIIMINAEAKRIFNFDAIHIQNVQLKDLFFSANNFPEQQLFSNNPQTNNAFEIYARRYDGSSVPVNLKVKKFEEAGVSILSVRDLTGLHEFDKSRLAAVVDCSEDAIISKDLNGKILTWNKGAEQLFQYKASEAIGKHISIIIPPEKMHEESLILSRIREEMPERLETYRVRKDGSRVDVSICISPLKNIHGKIIGAAKIARDITHQVQMINRLVAQNKQLDEFAHIIAHNFRTPVSNMQSLLYFYGIESDAESREIYISKLNACIESLNETFDHLLDVLYVQHGKTGKLELISFTDILDKVLHTCEGEIKKSGAKISADFSAVEQFYYLPEYLENIIQNLISNALKYCHSQRVPEVFLKTENESNKIMLSVTDNCLGIDLKKHGSKLFGFHKTFHNHPQAKGVGLYLVKTQVEAMGGNITVESIVNKGTTFRIIF